jgi:molecular chaperone DnaJ
MNLYEILGVPKNATKDEIREKYREMAKKYHPDRYINVSLKEKAKAEEMFKNINSAHEILIDDDKREEYDRATFGTNYYNGGGTKRGAETDRASYQDIYEQFSKKNMDEMFDNFFKKETSSKEKTDDSLKSGVNNMFESFFSFDKKKGKGKK